MKRRTSAKSVILATLLLCSTASAQGSSGNQNDLRLENEGEFLYAYDEPSIGPEVGTSGVPDFATNTYVWRTFSRDVLRHCSGAMEVSSIVFQEYDTDLVTVDASGNNVALPDMFLGIADASGPQAPTGTIEPDQVLGTLISFGDGGPGVNNSFLPSAGCGASIQGFEIQADVTGGQGSGHGIPIVADGATDLVFTTFIPGGGQSISGPSGCPSSVLGDVSLCDLHSGRFGFSADAEQENEFDLIGRGDASCWGGAGTLGATLYPDFLHEVNTNYVQFTEPVLAMVVDANTGHIDPGPANGQLLSIPDPGLEEGLAALHYHCPQASGGELSARLYAWQGLDRPAFIVAAMSPPLATCINFRGGKLGISSHDPLFPIFLGQWKGRIGAADNQYAIPSGTDLDDHVFNAPVLRIPAGLLGPPGSGAEVPLSFQGFFISTSGRLVGTQVTRLTLHA